MIVAICQSGIVLWGQSARFGQPKRIVCVNDDYFIEVRDGTKAEVRRVVMEMNAHTVAIAGRIVSLSQLDF